MSLTTCPVSVIGHLSTLPLHAHYAIHLPFAFRALAHPCFCPLLSKLLLLPTTLLLQASELNFCLSLLPPSTLLIYSGSSSLKLILNISIFPFWFLLLDEKNIIIIKKRTMLLMHKIRTLWYREITVLDSAAEPRANATRDVCRDFTHRCIAAKSDCRFFDITWCITRMVLFFLARVVRRAVEHNRPSRLDIDLCNCQFHGQSPIVRHCLTIGLCPWNWQLHKSISRRLGLLWAW